MTDREIMQQALDEMARYQVKSGDFDRFDDVIKNLRQALAQPEQEPVAWMMPDYGDVLSASEADGTGIYNVPLYTAPTKREQKSISTNDHLCAMLRQVHDVLACTALPMKRPWVGLTNEELVELREAHEAHIFNLMFAVEAKVREKNNAL